MKINEDRSERLKKYVLGVINEENGRDLYFSYLDDINTVTPNECFEIFFSKIEKGYSPKEILEILDKVLNVFHESISNYDWEKPKKGTFLDIMMRENAGLEEKLDSIKSIIKRRQPQEDKEILLEKVKELEEFNDHYLKKENILFPYLEKKVKRFEGLTIMWSLHDDARDVIKRMIRMLERDKIDEYKFNVEIGELFFTLLGLVSKEETILFPSAMEVLEEKDFEEMNRQSLEYSFPFIERPHIEVKESQVDNEFQGLNFRSETGQLSFEQLVLILNTLPVDFSFVDENNKFRYFSSPKDRIFPRSPASIGRDVNMCHPAESVHVVEKIVEKFRSGEEDKADFWIDLRGRKILIQYFALRNSDGEYKGVLEVSQDITDIQMIKGQRRLLEW